MSEENWQVVKVLLRNGKHVRVIAEAVVGDYAIHQRMQGGHACGKGFTITHVPSGLSVYSTLLESDALVCASKLDKMGLDFGKMNPDQYARLLETLINIAPRFAPPAVYGSKET